jgi:glutaconyl-CoA/methylmalonyl-CoA decarboxylase subunit gamma
VKMTIKMPRLAETSDVVVVETVLVSAGEALAVGQAMLVVETDKALVEVPSPVAGQIIEILVAPDEEVVTGAAIAVVEG